MSNKVLVQTQNFFVDTSKPTIGECRDATFVLPQGLMDCDEDQEMRVTLNAFSMRNNWYRVNNNNFAFFIVGYDDVNDVISAARCQLAQGNYEFFHDTNPNVDAAHPGSGELSSTSLGHMLKSAVQLGLRKMSGTKSDLQSFPTDINWESAGGLYDIKIDASSRFSLFRGGLKLVCFNIPQYKADPTNIVDTILQTPHYIGTDTFKFMTTADTGQTKDDPTNWIGAPWTDANGNENIFFIFPAKTFPKNKYTPQAGDLVTFQAKPTAGATKTVDTKCVVDSFDPNDGFPGQRVLLKQLYSTMDPLLDDSKALTVTFNRLSAATSEAIRGTTCHTLNFDKSQDIESNVNVGEAVTFPNSSGSTLSVAELITTDPDTTTVILNRAFRVDMSNPGTSNMASFPTSGSPSIPAQPVRDQKSTIVRTNVDPTTTDIAAGDIANFKSSSGRGEFGKVVSIQGANPGPPVLFNQITLNKAEFVGVVSNDPQGGTTPPPTNEPEFQQMIFESIDETVVNQTIRQDSFQSTFEILGGCYEDRSSVPGNTLGEQFNNLKSMFADVTSPGSAIIGMQGTSPASLQSEENLYLRTDLNSTGYQTPGFDTGLQRNVASSLILAKIPLNNPTFAGTREFTAANPPALSAQYAYQRPYEVIYYADNGNNAYSILLSSKKESQIRLFVTDKFGRLIAANDEQVKCGLMSFTATLRIDTFEHLALPQ